MTSELVSYAGRTTGFSTTFISSNASTYVFDTYEQPANNFLWRTTVNAGDSVVMDVAGGFPYVSAPAEVIRAQLSPDDIAPFLVATTAFTNAVATAIGSARTTDFAAVRSIVTGTGATGFQLSSTRGADVNYKIQTSTTATIGGASTATVVLEVAPTNSATAGDWKEVGRVSNSQTITLAVALQSVQVTGGSLVGYVPAGYYAKIRSITSGTASTTYLTGQETLL